VSRRDELHSRSGQNASIVEPADFERCFEADFEAVHRYIARRLGVPLADDLAAETFATAFRRRHSFNPDVAPARAWLLGIASNLVREQWRAEQRFLGLGSRLLAEPARAGDAQGPDEQVAASGLAAGIGQALASLPARQREVLLLHAWGGLTHQEIAMALGLAEGTVRSRLWRARDALRARLQPPDVEVDVAEARPGLASLDLATNDARAGGRRGR